MWPYRAGGAALAVYGAAGLEALAGLHTPEGGSLLEKVTHLSSVSGGSLAASYYALHKPPRETPILGSGGALTDPYRAFFADFRDKVGQDFDSAISGGKSAVFALSSIRPWQPGRSPNSLPNGCWGRPPSETWVRVKSGDSPRLIVNTTLYNNGRRLVMANLPPEGFHYDFFADLKQSLAKRGQSAEYPPFLVQRWDQLFP